MRLFVALALVFVARTGWAGTVVDMKTSFGNIVIELNDEKAPVTVKNFLGYVNDKFYDGTVFHRVIDGFMIQGGGFTATKAGGLEKKDTKAPIVNEASKSGLTNDKGTIAMARTNDPNSATSQFFINHKDNSFLNPNPSNPAGYAVFGKVIKGMEVVEKIAKVETTTKQMMGDVPATTVTIESVRVKKADDKKTAKTEKKADAKKK